MIFCLYSMYGLGALIQKTSRGSAQIPGPHCNNTKLVLDGGLFIIKTRGSFVSPAHRKGMARSGSSDLKSEIQIRLAQLEISAVGSLTDALDLTRPNRFSRARFESDGPGSIYPNRYPDSITTARSRIGDQDCYARGGTMNQSRPPEY